MRLGAGIFLAESAIGSGCMNAWGRLNVLWELLTHEFRVVVTGGLTAIGLVSSHRANLRQSHGAITANFGAVLALDNRQGCRLAQCVSEILC